MKYPENNVQKSWWNRKDIKTTLGAGVFSFLLEDLMHHCSEMPDGSHHSPTAFSIIVFWFWWSRTSQGWLDVGGDSYYEVAPLVVREGNRKKDRPLLREQLQRTAAIFCVLWKAASVAANQMRSFWGAKAWLGEGQTGEKPGFLL